MLRDQFKGGGRQVRGVIPRVLGSADQRQAGRRSWARRPNPRTSTGPSWNQRARSAAIASVLSRAVERRRRESRLIKARRFRAALRIG